MYRRTAGSSRASRPRSGGVSGSSRTRTMREAFGSQLHGLGSLRHPHPHTELSFESQFFLRIQVIGGWTWRNANKLTVTSLWGKRQERCCWAVLLSRNRTWLRPGGVGGADVPRALPSGTSSERADFPLRLSQTTAFAMPHHMPRPSGPSVSQLEAGAHLQACPGQLHSRTPPLGAVSTCRVTRNRFSQGSMNLACCDRGFGRAISSLKEKKR